MPQIENEETIMASDDNKITLTNYRVIYKTSQSTKEILLKDVVGYELKYKREGALFFIGLIVLVIGFVAFSSNIVPFYIITLIFMLAYFILSTKILNISGGNYNLEIPVSGFSPTSLQKLINSILAESENRKKVVS